MPATAARCAPAPIAGRLLRRLRDGAGGAARPRARAPSCDATGVVHPARLHRHDRRRLLRRLRVTRLGTGCRGWTEARPGDQWRRARPRPPPAASSRRPSARGGPAAGPGHAPRPQRLAARARRPPRRRSDRRCRPHRRSTRSRPINPNPAVPEEKRTCSKCGTAIGRCRDGKPGRTEGFCPKCGQEFSFTPKLQAGDLVGGPVRGRRRLAHGGLGWIYLAQDRNVSDRWVVLKGLLNSGDPDALAAAIAEQQFLAQVEHPLIVEIYNFVTHEGAGYIVMEYVGGRSLKQILKQRMRDNGGRLRPAAGRPGARLHPRGAAGLPVPPRPRAGLLRLQARQPHPGRRRGQADRPRRRAPDRRRGLRDLRHRRLPGPRGGRRSAPASPPTSTRSGARWWCCAWSSAATRAPTSTRCRRSRRRPLFAAARLALLADRQVLRDRPGRPVRLGRRAAHAAARRAARGGRRADDRHRARPPRPRSSSRRRPRRASALDWSQLPALRADPSDPQHAWLTSVGDADDPADRLAALEQAPEESAEVLLRRATAALELGDTAAGPRLRRAAAHPGPVGVAGAVDRRPRRHAGPRTGTAAKGAFNAVYQQVPGELGAQARARDRVRERRAARGRRGPLRHLRRDRRRLRRPGRLRHGPGARRRAATPPVPYAALDLVPSHQPRLPREPPAARRRAARRCPRRPRRARPGDEQHRVGPDGPGERQRYTVRILSHALDVVTRGAATSAATRPTVGGVRGPGAGAARRAGERLPCPGPRRADTLDARVDLVNQANAVRNWTLV